MGIGLPGDARRPWCQHVGKSLTLGHCPRHDDDVGAGQGLVGRPVVGSGAGGEALRPRNRRQRLVWRAIDDALECVIVDGERSAPSGAFGRADNGGRGVLCLQLDMAVLPFLWVSECGVDVVASWEAQRPGPMRSEARVERYSLFGGGIVSTCDPHYSLRDPGPTRSRVAQYACRRVADVSTVEATIT